MANNRIYLKCNVCGKTLFLGKSYLEGFFYTNYEQFRDPNPATLEIKLNNFYDEHAYCEGSHNDGDFSIEYENPLDSKEE